jgi:hypothetical protein
MSKLRRAATTGLAVMFGLIAIVSPHGEAQFICALVSAMAAAASTLPIEH